MPGRMSRETIRIETMSLTNTSDPGPSLDELRDLDPTEFEGVVADLYETKGWDTHRTQSSKDGGIDVLASKGGETLAIQAKRYASDNKVGAPEMREYGALPEIREHVDSVAVVTTGYFSTDAQVEAYENDIETVNGDELVAKLGEGDESTESSSIREESEPTRATTALRGWLVAVSVAAAFLIVGLSVLIAAAQGPLASVAGTLGFFGIFGLPIAIALDAIHLRRHDANYQPSLFWALGAFMTLGIVGLWYWVRRTVHTDLRAAYGS